MSKVATINACFIKGLPFEVKLPSDETWAAIQELESGKASQYASMQDVWHHIAT